MKRRAFLKNTSLLTLSAGLFSCSKSLDDYAAPQSADLKVAFISDAHVEPGFEDKVRKAIRHLNSQTIKPDFIINGGDTIMDSMSRDKDNVKAQWETWSRVMQQENKFPIYHTIGNHDIWGWKVPDPSIKTDPLYGKKWVVNQLGMKDRYYTFTKDRWKFIILDSNRQSMDYFAGYLPELDSEQFRWLVKELDTTSPHQHVCIVSHVPIVSFCAAIFSGSQPNGDWVIPPFLLHIDSQKLTELFSNYSNIRCCLSGHVHLQDGVEFKGIQYYCNGSLSGRWWQGPFHGIEPAYALFEFKSDGSVSREIITYG